MGRWAGVLLLLAGLMTACTGGHRNKVVVRAAGGGSAMTATSTAVAPAGADPQNCEKGATAHAGKPMLGVAKADGVYEVAVDGSSTTRVSGTDANSMHPAWSPDGTKVAFVEIDPAVRTPSGNPPSNIRVADMPTGCWTALTTQHTDLLMYPSWSPDGAELAYVRHANGTFVPEGSALEVVGTDGSRRATIAGSLSPAAWAPDDSGRIAFSDREGLKLRLANGEVRVLDHVGGSEFAAWSPDCSKIAFSISTQAALWLVNPDGTGLKPITPVGQNFFASWSPDGTKLVYNNNGSAWLVNGDGTDPHSVAGDPTQDRPLWSPSGDQIAFQSRTDLPTGRGSVMVVASAGGEAREVVRDVKLVAFLQSSLP